MLNKHNIPVATPKPVQHKEQVATVSSFLHPDFSKYQKYATLTGKEKGCILHVMTPVAHPDFKAAMADGLHVTERWERGDGRYGQ